MAQCTTANYLLPDVTSTFTGSTYAFTSPQGYASGNTNVAIQFDGSLTNTGCRGSVVLASGLEQFDRNFFFNQSSVPANQVGNGYMLCHFYYFDSNNNVITMANSDASTISFVVPAGVNKFYINTRIGSASISGATFCNGNNQTGYSRVATVAYLGKNITPTATISNESGCQGSNNGAISLAIDATTATSPYTYTWSSVVAGFTPPATNTNALTNLTPGEYTCVITDSSSPVKTTTKKYTIKPATPYDAYITTTTNCSSYGLTIDPIANIINSNDFSVNSGITISGDASYDIAGGFVRLTPDQTGKDGKVIINNSTSALVNNDFEVSFRMKFLNKSGADGFSFNIGNDSFPGNAEDGVNQGLAVRFKVFNQDNASLYFNGIQIGSTTNINLETGNWINIKLKIIGQQATLFIDGNPILLNNTITAYSMNSTYKYIFRGRTGGASNEMLIDDFKVGLLNFEYSIDGTTFQTSNTFSNITLPTNRTIPVWTKQNGCTQKVRDFAFSEIYNFNFTAITYGCDPTAIRITNQDNVDMRLNLFSTNFPLNDNFTLGLSAQKRSDGILLTDDKGGNAGYAIFSKLKTIDGATANNKNFAIEVVHKSLNKSGADGFSISFGDPTPIINKTVDFENGVTSGLAIRFKTFGNDLVQVFYNGVQVGSTVGNNGAFNVETGTDNTIYLEIKNSKLTLTQNGGDLFRDLQLPVAFTTDNITSSKLIIAARTGGSSNENLIKSVKAWDLSIFQARADGQITYTDLDIVGIEVPMNPNFIIGDKINLYLKSKNGCDFDRILKVDAGRTPTAPTATSPQLLNSGSTIADLTATGTNIKWYAATTGGTPLATTTSLVNGTTYYASQSSAYGCESNRTSVLVDTTSLSTTNFELYSKLSIYPNPTNGLVGLELNGVTFTKVSLFDLNGRTIQTVNANSNKATLDLSGLTSGIYLAKIETAEGTTVQKIVKE